MVRTNIDQAWKNRTSVSQTTKMLKFFRVWNTFGAILFHLFLRPAHSNFFWIGSVDQQKMKSDRIGRLPEKLDPIGIF